jgi:hypothetical protein
MTDHLINPRVTFLDQEDSLVIRKDQEITSDFLDTLADERLQSSQGPTKEFHRFASIPVAVVEKWQREGFDILSGQHSAKEIMRKLQSEDLGAFITTNKRL